MKKREVIRKWLEKIKNDFYTYRIFEIRDDYGDDENYWRKFDDIYVNVIMQAERQLENAYPETFKRHEIFNCHLKIHEDAKKLTKVTEIFKPSWKKTEQSFPRSILVIGRPGIGKTMLAKKLIYEWKRSSDDFWHDKLALLIRCRTIAYDNLITIKDMLSNCDGLSNEQFAQIYDFIQSNPDRIILIFDGLDELPLNNERLRFVGSVCADAKLPAFTLLSMLVENKLLRNATVLITSRPTAEFAFKSLKFDRTVEILGFFEDQIIEYVDRFCGEDKNTMELILNYIKSSHELRSLCYIPVNTYIICLTLKECFINNSKDIPKTTTELYKRAVKILLWRHHPRCKAGLIPKPNRGYLIKDLPKELGEDIQKMKSLAKKGIDAGKLIFDEPSLAEFPNLANCGLFHQIPDKRRDLYCFLHLTLQEFLAAWFIIGDLQKVGKFLDDHVKDPKWHLVIEFIAGLMGDVKRKGNIMDIQAVNDVEKRLKTWITQLTLNERNQTLGLLGVKCLYELQDRNIIKSACKALESAVSSSCRRITIANVSFTPVDSNSLFEFLSECIHITKLRFSFCKFLDNHSCLRMKLFLSNMIASDLISLQFLSCKLNYHFWKYLSEALKSENCKLTELCINGDKLTNQCAKYISEALINENCKLVKLIIYDNELTDQGLKDLSKALKSDRCKLNALNISDNKVTDEGANYVSEALKTKHCKLNKLDISNNEVTDKGAKDICQAIKNENCNLTELHMCDSKLSDQVAEELGISLESGKCKLTKLFLSKNRITSEGVKHLCKALKSANCQLTDLYISENNIADNGAKYLSEALQSENCKLIALCISVNSLQDKGAKYLSQALKNENCKLLKLNIRHNNLTDQFAQYLCVAFNNENFKLFT
ncbi:NACHT, LRR and PYD domains-containing protein 3-like [Xenia sp. Carnegie-2017]|uniref:NACHT, LRR and PYD domains-containing protein 3-like n=1 Tax=Xenia sp. Carnegie-2017 TaxID=2897299 RepID=UPI001F046BB4|nr:NACHT, LRR and PYD domains-containing protein 3-like [Xenia sp. Carnegie-2017]